ncbi:Gfo/Idh/MocA family protein [Fodinicola feengrottensis]|uniref:Gfo/Idh/MocA family protein n=1 Tax=Fodinicola feengrottensis TaxID=435914 RepID=UPI002442EDC9|nr:Gfo/Idh/MocA family oxidoreductase [Fodinicola feengrottensis]
MSRGVDQQVRVAIVGTGNIAGSAHLPALRGLGPEVAVVGAADVHPGALAAFAAQWDIPDTDQDVPALLARTEPDLVVVCSPPGLHSEHASAALRAGAWVWCEKPPARSLAEYDAMIAAESEGGPYAAIVFQQRYGSGTRHLAGLVRDGSLGDPLVALCQTTWYRDDAYFAVPWRGKFETEGGGPAMALGIHQIDLMLAVLGDWAEIRAMTGTLARNIETDDVSMACVRFERGTMATVVTSALSPREESYLRFDFRDATVELSHLYGYQNANWRFTPAHHCSEATEKLWPSTEDVPSSHAAALDDLLASMRAGERPKAGGARAAGRLSS